MSVAAEPVSSFVLSAADAVALGWDLADPEPSIPPSIPAESAHEVIFLGVVNASQRGIKGEVSLDVMLDANGAWVEIGPLRFERSHAFFLARLLRIAKAILSDPATASALVCPPWEGETRP